MMCLRNTVTQYLIKVSVILSDVIGSRAFPNNCHPERSEAPAERSRKPALSEAEGDPA
jgi:hypothetical protein